MSPRDWNEGEAKAARILRQKLPAVRFDDAAPPEPMPALPAHGTREVSPPAVAPVEDLGNALYDVALLDQIKPAALKAGQLSRVTIQLHPPELGSVAIAVESREGRLHAHFHSTHPFVAGWLEANAPALRAQLADAGLRLHDVTLSTSAHQQGGSRHSEAFPWEQQAELARTAAEKERVSVGAPGPGLRFPVNRTDNLVDCFA
jgi:hypothetical protein